MCALSECTGIKTWKHDLPQNHMQEFLCTHFSSHLSYQLIHIAELSRFNIVSCNTFSLQQRPPYVTTSGVFMVARASAVVTWSRVCAQTASRVPYVKRTLMIAILTPGRCVNESLYHVCNNLYFSPNLLSRFTVYGCFCGANFTNLVATNPSLIRSGDYA